MPSAIDDLVACVRFWSRVPLPYSSIAPDLARSIRMLPVAGAIIAAPAAVVLLVLLALGMPHLLSAGLALATLMATTGALHEDGLADTCDGLFGGATPERRLEIMRDSRIGTFGALALGLSLILRIAALSALADFSAWLACAAFLSTAAFSRTVGLLPLACLQPARADGLGAGVAQPNRSALQIALVIAIFSLVLPVMAGVSVSRTIVAAGIAVVAAYALVPLARAKIGGQTGDIAGASQQLSEIAFLAVLSGAAGS